MVTQQRNRVGAKMARTEDQRLLIGKGQFVDDLSFPKQLIGFLLRSPHAHARISKIDFDSASQAPGVHAIFIAADVSEAGLSDLPQTKMWMPPGRPAPSRPLLAKDKVNFVGEGVALIVAATLYEAQHAAELIEVEYVPLAPLMDMRDSKECCFEWEEGDYAAVEQAFASAEHTCSLETVVNRIAVSPLEPRAAIGIYDTESGYRLYVQSQGVHHIRNVLADHVFGISRDRLQVLTGDVGGAFGMKVAPFPEYVLVLFAARELGRPVKWVSDRAEAFVCDTHGRDQIIHTEIAFDGSQRIIGLRASKLSAMGAYITGDGPEMATNQFSKIFGHTYTVPSYHVRVRGIITNTSPIAAYRGYGKPEAVMVVEQLIDKSAREMGIDRIELRRRNFISEDLMPYTNAAGTTYDSGAFERVMDAVLKSADWDGFAKRRLDAERRGKKRGIGLGMSLQMTMGISKEASEIELSPDGAVVVKTSMQACGQGHQTTYAQLVSKSLGVPFETVVVKQGNSALLPDGVGTGASTGLTIGGSTIVRATETLIEQCRVFAAEHFEVALDDVVYFQGNFVVAGTDRRLDLFELAQIVKSDNSAGCMESDTNPTIVRLQMEDNLATTPYGAYVAEVEVDIITGATTVIAFTAVNDLGLIVNPAIAEGQIHGGIAQGVGQSLVEDVVYDTQTGQLLTGSFMDYCMPRATDLPILTALTDGVATLNNPLGAKGAGEIGTIGSIAPVLNAVTHAIENDALKMPVVSERIWRAMGVPQS